MVGKSLRVRVCAHGLACMRAFVRACVCACNYVTRATFNQQGGISVVNYLAGVPRVVGLIVMGVFQLQNRSSHLPPYRGLRGPKFSFNRSSKLRATGFGI